MAPNLFTKTNQFGELDLTTPATDVSFKQMLTTSSGFEDRIKLNEAQYLSTKAFIRIYKHKMPDIVKELRKTN